MTISTTTHLNFRGNAREALAFYQSVFGGHLFVMTHAQTYGTDAASPEADWVSFGQVQAESGFRIMAFDVPTERPYDAGITPLFVSLQGTDVDEVSAYWPALIEGGTVIADLGPAAWSPLYGMVQDRFGITWVVGLANS